MFELITMAHRRIVHAPSVEKNKQNANVAPSHIIGPGVRTLRILMPIAARVPATTHPRWIQAVLCIMLKAQ
jgi:hypothetical protein